MVRARLVTAEADTVELAHEALARAWPRLQSWLDEDAAGQRILRHLAAAATGWDSLGRPDHRAVPRRPLGHRLGMAGGDVPDLTELEAAFLDASGAQATSEREQLARRVLARARQNRRLRRALTAIAVLLVAALVGGIVAYQQRQTAQDQRAPLSERRPRPR